MPFCLKISGKMMGLGRTFSNNHHPVTVQLFFFLFVRGMEGNGRFGLYFGVDGNETKSKWQTQDTIIQLIWRHTANNQKNIFNGSAYPNVRSHHDESWHFLFAR